MEWRKHFKGGYRSVPAGWSVEPHRDGWHLSIIDGPRPYGRWRLVKVFHTLREAKEYARRAADA